MEHPAEYAPKYLKLLGTLDRAFAGQADVVRLLRKVAHPYGSLVTEYIGLLLVMRMTRDSQIAEAADRILERKSRYAEVSANTGVPAAWLMAVDERESSGDVRSYLGNGEKIIGTGAKTVLVPAGRGPFQTWQDGAIDAIVYERIDRVDGWSMPRACYEAETWNGFGPRNHGRYTGYLWAGTNVYTGGKYVSDGHWDPNETDQQLGIVPLMLRLAELDSSLVLPGTVPVIPKPPPTGLHNALWIQRSLNHLGQHPRLVEDGNYGRRTKNAVIAFQATHGLVDDGLVGPLTQAAIEVALEIAK